jgi:IclR family transcriptional regulator, acetate operon repressor
VSAGDSTKSPGRTHRRPGVINALTAVETLAAGGGEMGLVQIASALGLDPAQVRRMLRQLMADGWIAQANDSAPYTFGTRMFSLSGRVLGNLDIVRAGQKVMRSLRDESGETVHLGVVREDRIVCVGRELSTHSVVAVATAVGDSWPMTGSAMGSAVRSVLPPSGDEAADADATAARHCGYGLDLGHHKSGIVGVAAAVLDYRGAPVGAIAVSGPIERLGPPRQQAAGELVAAAARQLSAAFGHPVTDGEATA